MATAPRITSFGGGIGVPRLYGAMERSEGARNAEHMKRKLSSPSADAWNESVAIKFGIVELLEKVPALVRLIESRRAKPGFIVASELDLDEAPKAYRRFDKKLEAEFLFRGPGREGREDFVWEAEQHTDGVAANETGDRLGERAERIRLR